MIEIEDEDYQGDTRVLYEKDGKYGYLIFGWGSCSGCDALKACSNYEDIGCLIKELEEEIKWFESPKETLDFFRNHDWEGDWSWHTGGTREFIEKAIKFLAEKI